MGKQKFKCVITNCGNKYIRGSDIINKHFFNIPLSPPAKREQWIKLIKLSVTSNPTINIPKNARICQDHFPDNAFSNSSKSQLNKFAIPSLLSNIEKPYSEVPELNAVDETRKFPVNLDASPHHAYIITDHHSKKRTVPVEINCPHSGSRKKPRLSLKEFNCRWARDLSPRKRLMYEDHKRNKRRLCLLRAQLRKCRKHISHLEACTKPHILSKLTTGLSTVAKNFIESQLTNADRIQPTWTMENKAFALALYKDGPQAYIFFKNILKLPSKSTINSLLKEIPIYPGLNTNLLDKLTPKFSKMSYLDKHCILSFDELSLSTDLTYCSVTDQIIGYEDLGFLGRTNQMANHGLVFLISGLRAAWKQPIAFFLTRNSTKATKLKQIIVGLIEELHKRQILVIATVCDQGSTNCSAIKQLTKETCTDSREGSDFFVNNNKIITFFDTPHLLKNTRNALARYNIRYNGNKIARFCHIIRAQHIDAMRRFPMLHKKLNKRFLLINAPENRFLKMKVSVAAKTLSASMSSCINTCISTAPGMLPATAIETAEFVNCVNDLFDSFNGNSLSPVKGNKLRCAVRSNSKHIEFWDNKISEISKWQFVTRENYPIRSRFKFKDGWINNIRAIKELWKMCSTIGFTYLRTRAINQDPLENLFSSIPQHGAANNNPSCFQFVQALKTAVVNNLTSHKGRSKNC